MTTRNIIMNSPQLCSWPDQPAADGQILEEVDDLPWLCSSWPPSDWRPVPLPLSPLAPLLPWAAALVPPESTNVTSGNELWRIEVLWMFYMRCLLSHLQFIYFYATPHKSTTRELHTLPAGWATLWGGSRKDLPLKQVNPLSFTHVSHAPAGRGSMLIMNKIALN